MLCYGYETNASPKEKSVKRSLYEKFLSTECFLIRIFLYLNRFLYEIQNWAEIG